ncbi:MAG: glycogen debranching enzyme N-terminal domain-containing protein, partial [Bdellovibrionales bacterium]|nr:glycogen debranching enzyme N-terminal domain-containing protein [Bdellovibrionales bacterium]
MKQFTTELEYLESCGNGSFASFTKSGVNTRRYHGLLVGGTAPDDHRAVFVSRCDEVLEVDGNQNELGTRLFQDAIAPQGFQNLKGSAWDLYPELVYHHAGVELRKAVLALHGHSTVMLRYQIIAPGLCGNLCLEPFVSLRPYHALYVGRSEAIDVCFDDGVLGVQNQANGLDVFMGLAGSSFCYRGEWHRNVYYPADRERGYDYLEDVYLPGVLSVPFEAQAEFFIVLSTQREAVRLGREAWDLEVGRRRQLLDRPKARVLPRRLCYVASQFLVQDQASLNIIAGYPWFTCWARDSMIAIPGLCLSTGQFGAARQILTTWAAHLKDGLLPNRLGAGDPRYNSVDATLWFVNACYRYVLKSGDRAFIDSVADKIQEIIEYHIRGTHYGIKVDPEDGLLAAGDVSTQLTWMDACFEGVPVTPRYGKAI